MDSTDKYSPHPVGCKCTFCVVELAYLEQRVADLRQRLTPSHSVGCSCVVCWSAAEHRGLLGSEASE